MTIKQAFKVRYVEFHELHKPIYRIAFDHNKEKDETEFSVNSVSTAESDLNIFFKDFCKENGIRKDSVISIICVGDEAAGNFEFENLSNLLI